MIKTLLAAVITSMLVMSMDAHADDSTLRISAAEYKTMHAGDGLTVNELSAALIKSHAFISVLCDNSLKTVVDGDDIILDQRQVSVRFKDAMLLTTPEYLAQDYCGS